MNKKALPVILLLALATVSAYSGITGVGFSRGAVQRFGSVFVNDVEYFTTTAQVLIDGAPATEAQLRIGQVVTVDGSVNADGVTGTANTISFESDLRGAVTAVNAATSSFTLLGQVVKVNAATNFDDSIVPAALSALAPGTVVEVSGYRTANGSLNATRIDRSGSSTDRIVGAISSLNPATFTFRINGLTVNYSAAGQISGALADGLLAEVKAARTSGTVMNARSVETRSSELAGGAGEGGTVEGYVTQGIAGGAFIVDGQPVTVQASTVFVDGVAADLQADAKVRVEGVFDAAGNIQAQKIVFVFDDTARIHGIVTSMDLKSGRVTTTGVNFFANSSTSYDDRSRQKVRPFGLAQLRVGDLVEVRGYELRANATARLTKLERRDNDARTWLAGTVSAVRSGEFTLLDQVIQTTSATKYQDTSGRAISARQFYSQAPGRKVKAGGVYTGASVIATSVELEL
jgi:hypothetical protein